MPSSKLHLKIQNIGPHVNVDYSLEIKNLKMAIYARNGEGKTFISRAFRSMEIDDSLKTEYAKNLLRIKWFRCAEFAQIGHPVR